jgi:hypothetical protein
MQTQMFPTDFPKVNRKATEGKIMPFEFFDDSTNSSAGNSTPGQPSFSDYVSTQEVSNFRKILDFNCFDSLNSSSLPIESNAI